MHTYTSRDWNTPIERALAWGFLHGWLAAADHQPCDPPSDLAAGDSHHTIPAWVDGWCIASDQRARGVAIDGDAAVEVCCLYIHHTLTPRAEMH